MYCTKCGTYLFDEHQFCINCGSPRPVPLPSKKGTRWIPILILVLMFALGCFVYYASTAYPPVDETPAMSVQSGALMFDESKYEGDPELVVPSIVDGQTVTEIGTYCFRSCDSLTSVTLPGTVEIIDPCAFFDCENLQTIKLTDGLLIIDSDAFYSCGSLESISIPGSVETIDAMAFSGCRTLKHIYFAGSQEDWEQIFFGEISPNTQIHYIADI